ncbi:MAG: sigma-54-dependent Fis family transcriptional regulator [Alphaproteobacteria bacterium 64-6]|uniref:nitrogen assimilation response regulator NtrX n=1 Tax=Hyphomicrobium sp. CS1BSMeth3 TaxID=1892844 RepID=UPI000930C3FA|nr:sigma-54 dependent transcriptional regulator [Hyphomicrobium sp. CS1BSMeth3]MBN9259369.1 sigma-54-dependent Fis family transcriptional regulator [Hyphomicrobium sp.]OJU31034.1 MAG: sigma-54-dependent Fis family transcriptional regulator [Alphaproteobacteria bacterium 64-6]
MAADILIVDDEADIRELVSGILEDEGHSTRMARDADEGLKAIEERRPHLIILDIWLQGSRLDGLEMLSAIKKQHPDLPVVIISGHGNIETAVTAIRRGAYDYIEKPFKADRLVLVTLRALEASQLRREVKTLRERSVQSSEMVGKSAAINQLRNQIERVAPTNSRILIRGASGSGKELAARVIHAKSSRADGPFVVLNAAAMAPDRVEEELFGTEDRSGPRKVGALEEAHGGTLYIDEVADMPLETQGKVLRVLVEQKFQRIGGGPKVAVDVRIISSTSRDLEREMQEERFRNDLYHRLNVVPLRVPSLAERRDDIPSLIEYFVQQVATASGLSPRRIGDDAVAVLQAHDWPGNVRELRNNIERLMILAGGDPGTVITADMLPEEIGSNVPLPVNGGAEHLMSLPLREAREIFEREYLLAQINRFGGNISRTAEFVGMERSALHRKLRALGVGSEQRAS